MWLTVLSFVGVPWTLLAAASAAVPLSAPFLATRAGRREAPALRPAHLPWWLTVAGGVLFATAAYAYRQFVRIMPMRLWDFVAIWGLKGRTFFEFGRIDFEFLRFADPLVVPHAGYPPLVPMIMVSTAVVSQQWSDATISVLHVVSGLALFSFVVFEFLTDMAESARAERVCVCVCVQRCLSQHACRHGQGWLTAGSQLT